MQISSVKVGKVTLNVGDEIEQPAQPARVLRKRNRETGALENVTEPAKPAKRFKIESFEVGTGGVRCRDKEGSQLTVSADIAVSWRAKK